MATRLSRILSLVIISMVLLCMEVCAQNSLSATIPYIKGIESLSFNQLDLTLEKSGTKVSIDKVNWPASYSYAPDCIASIAYGDKGIAICYHVRGLDLRAMNTEDNSPVCQDSCCEFFMLSSDGKNYFNFETNCIGIMHAALGANIKEREYFTDKQLSKIKRYSSLPFEAVEKNDSIASFTLAVVIPFEVMGLDPASLPESIKGNFYKCADKTSHPHYTSWNPIGTPRPNFHTPDYFGTLYFEKK